MNSTGIFTPQGGAFYTAGSGDGAGNGWLRLTTDGSTYRRGYISTSSSYSSDLGLVVEFDFKTWGNATANLADGFSIFLFDGSIASVSLAQHTGGTLGYLRYNNNGTILSGLSGGYMAVGVDEYGNFLNILRNNGVEVNGQREANNITITGPSTSSLLVATES